MNKMKDQISWVSSYMTLYDLNWENKMDEQMRSIVHGWWKSGTYNPGQNCRDNSCFSPFPLLQCWFFTVSKIKIRSSIAGMFQHCLGGRGAQKRQRKKNKRCSYNDGSVYSKFSTFRPKFDKCPEVFWPGLSETEFHRIKLETVSYMSSK